MGTYTSIIGADGSLHGDGQGLTMTADGDPLPGRELETANSGRVDPSATVECSFLDPLRQKLARLNNACVAFEYDVDPSGSTVSKMWEWK